MTSSGFQRLPGFRDFPPADLAIRNAVFAAWRRVARRYGFSEYDGPPLEPLDLYLEKSGAEIAEQLYAFEDKGGRDVALRPEMTPSLARILAERSRSMSKPIRWFSVPQLFRYERQQRGRLREHFQWNVDIVGEADVSADAEVLAVAVDGVRELGLDENDFRARVSDRRLLSAILDDVGVPEDARETAFGIIDKLERAGPDKTLERFRNEVALAEAAARRLLDTLAERNLEAVQRAFGERDEVAAEVERLESYFAHLAGLGMEPFVEFDLAIVRGLAYYTGIVFELFDREGELRAICGGGRYDRLLELVGGEPLPSVGFGMGDVVLTELLADRGVALPEPEGVDFFLVTISEEQRGIALELAQRLRARGASVAYALRSQSVRKQFSAAGNERAGRAVVLGPDELSRGVAVVRDMASGEERECPLDDVEAFLD